MIPCKTVTITIPGIPQGKGAARHTSRGFTYTPSKTRKYMSEISLAALAAGCKLSEDPCSMIITAYFPIPDSYPKRKSSACHDGLYLYVKKPDTDNISKIKDALKGIAFNDDAQVFKETVIKLYDAVPRLHIELNFYRQWTKEGEEPLKGAA